MLGGMILVVQGFETSRYLGGAYPADMRARTMLWAQISSAVIYMLFVALIVPVLIYLPAGAADDTAIIDVSGNVAWVLPFMLVFAALIWLFDIFEVTSIASRTFAFYYMMQTVIAIIVTRKLLTGRQRTVQIVWFSLLAVILALIVIFAVPAE